MTEFKHTVTAEEAGKSVKELMRQHFTFSSRLMTKLKFQKLIYLNALYLKPAGQELSGDQMEAEPRDLFD